MPVASRAKGFIAGEVYREAKWHRSGTIRRQSNLRRPVGHAENILFFIRFKKKHEFFSFRISYECPKEPMQYFLGALTLLNTPAATPLAIPVLPYMPCSIDELLRSLESVRLEPSVLYSFKSTGYLHSTGISILLHSPAFSL